MDAAGTDPARRREAWARSHWTWDLYFALGSGLSAAMLLGASTPPAQRAGSVLCVVLIAVCYVAFSRRVILSEDRGWRAWTSVVCLAVLFCVAVALTPMTAFALFVVGPMVFMSLELRHAVPVIVVVSLAPAILAGVLARAVGPLLDQLPLSLLSLAFALLLGTYLDRIIRQSTERAGLIAQLEATQAEVGRLSHEAGVSAERNRLAAEIHDTLAQGFASIITLVQAAQPDIGRDDERLRRRLDLVLTAARENLGEARALVGALTPAMLASGSLAEAVGRVVDGVEGQLGVPARFHCAGQPRPLPTGVEVVLLRAAQEALANVAKHADAHEVAVRLTYRDSSVALQVRDDGRGFQPDRPSAGYGLPGLRKRVEQAGGVMTLRSARGTGTEIEVEIPS